MGIIKRFFIKRALEKANSKSDIEKIADDVLKDALKELQQTGRTADKILKAKLIRQESQHTLNKMRDLDEDLEEEEEEESKPSIEDTLGNALIMKLLGGVSTQKKEDINFQGFDEEGSPLKQENKPSLNNILGKLSTDDIDTLKKTFLK